MQLLVIVLVVSALLSLLVVTRSRSRRSRLQANECLIGEAMGTLGISPTDAESAGLEAQLSRAAHQCRQCASAEHCRQWLSARGSSPDFRCPNSDFFSEVCLHKRVLAGTAPQQSERLGVAYEWRP